MAYGDTFAVGERIGFDNLFGYSFGTVTETLTGLDGEQTYAIRWDDGFVDEEGGTFYADFELTKLNENGDPIE